MNKPPVETTKSSDQVIEMVSPDGRISDCFGGEYAPTAVYRVRKYKPGKDPDSAQDWLDDDDADEQLSGAR
jgi:hypothetical protein